MTVVTEVAYACVGVFTAGIGGILLLGVRRRDTPTAVNAGFSIVAVVVPLALEFGLGSASGPGVGVGPALPLWIAVAGFLHSLGMVGLYERLWWWDHLTHTISGMFVAALLYAAFIVVAPRWSVLDFSPATIKILLVISTFWIGVFWELVELLAREIGEMFDIKPLLVHYGWRDTAYDLGFDIVGAVIVVLADIRVFVPITGQSTAITELFLVATAVITVGGSLLIAVGFTLLETSGNQSRS